MDETRQFIWDIFRSMSNRTSLTGAASACLRLSQLFTNNATFTPKDELYTEIAQASWSHTTWMEPSCIFVPRTVEDLQLSIPIIVEENSGFSIRSGGHMPVPGASSVDRGVLIDLSRFTRLEYDADKSQAVVGPGLRWQNVYDYLDQYEVTVVGGRVLDVGVGGLILGSGLSYLSERYGMACDNVVNFEVVLADGSLVDANESSHPDLFWALKGGSNNFGIVTAFTLKTYPVYRVWGGTRIIPWDRVDDFLDAMIEYESSPHRDPQASVNINLFVTNETALGILLTLVYLEPVENPTVFAPFLKFNATLDTTGVRTLTEVMGEFPTPPLPRIRFMATTVKPTTELTHAIKGIMRNSPHVDTIRSATAGTAAFSWQPISPNLVEAGQRAGGNALGLSTVPQSWFHLDFLWWNEEDDEAIRIAGESILGEIEAAAKEQGSHLRFIFMNDANERQPVIASYGEENVHRMWQVQDQYDPDRIFHRLLAGAFKVPEKLEGIQDNL